MADDAWARGIERLADSSPTKIAYCDKCKDRVTHLRNNGRCLGCLRAEEPAQAPSYSKEWIKADGTRGMSSIGQVKEPCRRSLGRLVRTASPGISIAKVDSPLVRLSTRAVGAFPSAVTVKVDDKGATVVDSSGLFRKGED